MNDLERAVLNLLQNFERVGGESDAYLRAVAGLRKFVYCDNRHLDDLDVDDHVARPV